MLFPNWKKKKKKTFPLKKKRQGIGHCCREFGSPWPFVITKRSTFHGSICVPKLIHAGPKNSFLGNLGRPLALGMLHFYLIFFVGFIPILYLRNNLWLIFFLSSIGQAIKQRFIPIEPQKCILTNPNMSFAKRSILHSVSLIRKY